VKPTDLVAATERLYRSLFAAAIGLALAMSLWGMAIAPFNSFNGHAGLSLALGALLVAAFLAAFACRHSLYEVLRRRPALLLIPLLLTVVVLWIDGGWRSSYYLASYAAIGLAAVVADLRWSLVCAAVLAAGYIAGLGVNDYSWGELKALKDADSVVANTGGYMLAACFLAVPVAWLGSYVARINQVVAADAGESGSRLGPTAPSGEQITDRLSAREVEVVQLIASGATNEEIAEQLFVSPRTVQSHVKNAMEGTGTRNRTELAVLAVLEGLVPADTPLERAERDDSAYLRIDAER
jgi:DNA-binding CsgD family transcriptional regulator